MLCSHEKIVAKMCPGYTLAEGCGWLVTPVGQYVPGSVPGPGGRVGGGWGAGVGTITSLHTDWEIDLTKASSKVNVGLRK